MASDYRLLIQSDARRIPLPDNFIDCVVTSPPYFGLRDYGEDSQIGLEESPEEYIECLVLAFREVRRVLAKTGTLWLNIGDTYNSYTANRGESKSISARTNAASPSRAKGYGLLDKGLKKKDLLMIPARVAIALQADGWYLRSKIVWHKPNGMPESPNDRPSSSHEEVFLFSKSGSYYYDKFAERNGDSNLRNVWAFPIQPYHGAHFATMPRDLASRCIRLGSSERGRCPECLGPWARVPVTEPTTRERPNDYVKRSGQEGTGNSCPNSSAGTKLVSSTWVASCDCGADPEPCVVFDPFNGAATTGLAAKLLGRSYVGGDISADYLKMSQARLRGPMPGDKLATAVVPLSGQLSMF